MQNGYNKPNKDINKYINLTDIVDTWYDKGNM